MSFTSWNEGEAIKKGDLNETTCSNLKSSGKGRNRWPKVAFAWFLIVHAIVFKDGPTPWIHNVDQLGRVV